MRPDMASDMTDELEALEWDFRRSLTHELRRVARKGDDRFFRLDQPRARNGKPTVLRLAEEVMEVRATLLDRLPSRPSAAVAFLLSCLKWSHSTAEDPISSAALARDLLASIESDNA
jgi:hypothetical protein